MVGQIPAQEDALITALLFTATPYEGALHWPVRPRDVHEEARGVQPPLCGHHAGYRWGSDSVRAGSTKFRAIGARSRGDGPCGVSADLVAGVGDWVADDGVSTSLARQAQGAGGEIDAGAGGLGVRHCGVPVSDMRSPRSRPCRFGSTCRTVKRGCPVRRGAPGGGCG